MHPPRIHVYACFLLSIVLQSAGESLPFERLDDIRGPFEGTGIRGDALYVRELGRVGKLPLQAYWSSARLKSSPLLGFGWCIPLLESKFVKADERRWAFHQPDGYVRIFIKASDDKENAENAKENALTLTGGSVWSAKIQNENITVVASPADGGVLSRFVFQRGRLIRMTCEEGDYEIKYLNHKLDQVVSRGKTLLKIIRKPRPVNQVIFQFGDDRRVVAELRETEVFTEMVQDASTTPDTVQKLSLSSLKGVGGKTLNFAYGTNPGEVVFAAGNDRLIWDAYTRCLKSCGGWNYNISKDAGGEEPSFERSLPDGRSEFYHYNRSSGLRRRRFADGSSYECQLSTSGLFAYRQIRWKCEKKANGTFRRTDYTYNLNSGRLYYRSTIDNTKGEETREQVWFDEAGRISRRKVNGKEIGR